MSKKNEAPKILAVRLNSPIHIGSQMLLTDHLRKLGVEGDTTVHGRKIDMDWDFDSRFIRVTSLTKDEKPYVQLIPTSHIAFITVAE